MTQMSQRYKSRPRPLSDEEIVALLFESDAENDPEVEDLVEDSTDEDYQPVANVESDSYETEDEVAEPGTSSNINNAKEGPTLSKKRTAPPGVGAVMAQTNRKMPPANVLATNISILRWSGLWPPERQTGWARLFAAYTAVAFLSQVVAIDMTLYHIYNSEGDIYEITLTMMVTMTLVGGVLKMLHFFGNADTYRRLVRDLQEVIDLQRGHCERDDAVSVIFCSYHRQAILFTCGSLGYLNVLAPTWFLMPVITGVATDPNDRKLPFSQLKGLRSNDLIGYSAAYFVQCHAIFYWNFISVGLDVFFATAMLHAAAQLKILSHRLSRLGKQTTRYEEQPPYWNALQGDTAPVRQIIPYEEENDLYSQLRSCIKNHQEILRLVLFLETVMGPVAFIQFLCSVVAACVALFQATFGLYVSRAAYSSGWVGASQRFTRALRIVMCRAQRPLQLTAGKLYPVNRLTFVSLINASYTFYALLRQMRDR
ncbi:odorant receptor Or2-like [Schistocerca americana]|uniref:odorant receptor Or2-like n=1 Tax=Schistocerca americana TaxID=7009 RepID=UPI001F4F74D8|nr:odorant receptor Or2-like [Schistocerca americana]